MRNEDIVLDGAKVFWRTLLPRLKAERGLLGLSVVLAFLAALAGIHPLAVLPFWIVLVAAILNRGAPPVQTAPASVGAAVETKADPLAPLLDALDMPVLVVAADETVVFQNAAAEKAFGTIPQDSYLSARVRSPAFSTWCARRSRQARSTRSSMRKGCLRRRSTWFASRPWTSAPTFPAGASFC